MKTVRVLSIASCLLALVLAFTGSTVLAWLLFTVSSVVELVASIILGKQSNEGTD